MNYQILKKLNLNYSNRYNSQIIIKLKLVFISEIIYIIPIRIYGNIIKHNSMTLVIFYKFIEKFN